MHWLAVALLAVIYYLDGFAADLLDGLLLVKPVVMGFVSMHVLMTSARILGLVYRNREEELNWL